MLFWMHNVFHVSILRIFNENLDNVIHFIDFELNSNMTYKEKPIKFEDFKEQTLKR